LFHSFFSFFQDQTYDKSSEENKKAKILKYEDSIFVYDKNKTVEENSKKLEAKYLGLKVSLATLNTLDYNAKKNFFQNRCPIIFRTELS
jgi:hypothetical protein